MTECAFPNCHRHAEANGFCIGHKGYGKEVTKPSKFKPQPRSKKMQIDMREYKKQVAIFLLKHKLCEIKSPVCTKIATTVNHMRRRGANLLNQEDWQASCWNCNGYIENHDAEAREKGHLKSVHKKIKA